jgi:hypothetical protein
MGAVIARQLLLSALAVFHGPRAIARHTTEAKLVEERAKELKKAA